MLSVIALVGAIIAGYLMVGTATCLMISEISSVFLSFKGMFLDPKSTKLLPVLNQLMFFLTYTVFRIVMFPYIAFYVTPGVIGVF